MAWITERLPAHGAIFLIHGEDEERADLRAALQKQGLAGDQVILPMLDDQFELRPSGLGARIPPAERRIDPEQMVLDWHNSYAHFIIALSQRLEASTPEQRLELMTALNRELGVSPLPELKSPAHVNTVHIEPGGE
jgi:metallo-beta-lactamase family protein